MTKISLNDVASFVNDASSVSTVNVNTAVIETAFDNTLSRNGSSPNQMEAVLDMNSHRIINLPAADSGDQPVTKAQLDVIGNGYTGNNVLLGTNHEINITSGGGTSTFSLPSTLDFSSKDFTGTVTSTTSKYINNIVDVINAADYGVATTVVDNGVPLNALINSFPANEGYVIHLPKGTLTFSTPINMDNKFSVVLQGKSGVNVGASIGTTLRWTGTGSGNAITMNGAESCEIRNCTIINPTASFTGKLLTCNVLGNDPVNCGVYNCSFFDLGPRVCTAINLDKSENFYINQCKFQSFKMAIEGRTVALSYAIGTTIKETVFLDGDATQGGYISNPHMGWLIQSCIFEPDFAHRPCGIITTDPAYAFQTLNIISCQFLDVTAGGSNWLTLTGDGLVFIGNVVGAATGLANANGLALVAVTNATIKSNFFQGLTNAIGFGAGCSNIELVPNSYPSCANIYNSITLLGGYGFPGYTSLPNGMLMQYGSSVVTTGTPLVVTYPISYNAAPIVQITLDGPSGLANTASTGSVNSANMTLNVAGTAGTSTVRWTAIGSVH